MDSLLKTQLRYLATLALSLTIQSLWLMFVITVTLWLNLLVMYRLGIIGIIGPE